MLLALESDLGSWDPVVRGVPFMLGLALLVVTAMSILRTMVVPRTTPSFIYAVVLRLTDLSFNAITRVLRGFNARDRLLAWCGPLGVIIALFTWLVLFLLAYSLMIFGVSAGSFPQSVLQAGSGLLTLGLVGTPSESQTIVDFLAAITGPAVIALLIGFLPTLYQAYLSREARVLLSSGRTGAPGWGPEMLARVQFLKGSDDLPDLYEDWVPWCAQTRLAQTLYPALNRFRSPVASRNWIIALLSVMDSAALRLAINDGPPDPRTAAFLEQGAQTLLSIYATEVEIDQVVRLRRWKRRFEDSMSAFGFEPRGTTPREAPVGPTAGLTPQMIAVARAVTLDTMHGRIADTRNVFLQYDHHLSTISREEYGQALDYMRSAGVKVQRSDDDSYKIFRRTRGPYEVAAYHLAERFSATPAPWSGERRPAVPTAWPALVVKEQEPE